MSDTNCPHCGARQNIHPYAADYDCGSNNEMHRTALCREREAHNATKRERDILREGSLSDPLLEITFREIVRERDEARAERDKWEEEAKRYCVNSEYQSEMRKKAETENAKLRDLAERAIGVFSEVSWRDDGWVKEAEQLRVELDQLKEEVKNDRPTN